MGWKRRPTGFIPVAEGELNAMTRAIALQALFRYPDQRQRQGQAAAAVVEANRGALEKGLKLISEQ